MRYLLCVLLAMLTIAGPPAAQAHDGPHSPDMMAVVISAIMQGNKVAVSMVLTGLGGPLVLTGLSAPGARAVEMDPVYVNFAQDVPITAVLAFPGAPPGTFTLHMDFGPLGRSAVSVSPEPGAISDRK